MGLLMSDTLVIDAVLEDTVRTYESLRELAYAAGLAGDTYEYEAVESTR